MHSEQISWTETTPEQVKHSLTLNDEGWRMLEGVWLGSLLEGGNWSGTVGSEASSPLRLWSAGGYQGTILAQKVQRCSSQF
jgi:hypothetical protein